MLLSFALMLSLTAPAIDGALEPAAAAHLAAGRLAEAAAAIEHGATLADPAQAEALWLAGEIRFGLGYSTRAVAYFSAVVRALATRSRTQAAAAFWRRRDLLRTDAERLEHARTYLRRHATVGGPERRMLAEATLGHILHAASCQRPGPGDLCVELQRYASSPPLPGRPLKPTIRTRPAASVRRSELKGFIARCGVVAGLWSAGVRTPGLAAEARSHLRRVVRLARDLAPTPEVLELLHAAEVRLLDPALEAFLARELPNDLRLYPDRGLGGSPDPADARMLVAQRREVARSQRVLAAELAALTAASVALRDRFAAIAARAGDGPAGRAAWLRIALVANHHANLLTTAGSVGGFPDQAAADRHCVDLKERYAPLVSLAKSAYERCYRLARAALDASETAALCEQRLVHLGHGEFADRAELVGPASHTASRPDVLGVQLDAGPFMSTGD